MRAILWTKSKTQPLPWEFVELTLCRDVYHIGRNELYEQDLAETLMDLEMLKIESEVAEFERQKAIGR